MNRIIKMSYIYRPDSNANDRNNLQNKIVILLNLKLFFLSSNLFLTCIILVCNSSTICPARAQGFRLGQTNKYNFIQIFKNQRNILSFKTRRLYFKLFINSFCTKNVVRSVIEKEVCLKFQ